MFGYVIPNQAALDDEAKARYRTAYCGLCRRIGALHGLRGRLTLSYDLTFLDLLLSSLYEGESECITGSDVTIRLCDKKLNFFGPEGCSCNATAR